MYTGSGISDISVIDNEKKKKKSKKENKSERDPTTLGVNFYIQTFFLFIALTQELRDRHCNTAASHPSLVPEQIARYR